MKKLATLITLFLVMAFAAPAFAADIKVDEAGVKLSTPTKWKTTSQDGTVELESPDETVNVVMTAMPAAGIEAAAGMVTEAILAAGMTDFTHSDWEEVELNGMPGIVADGKAKIEGIEVELGLAFILSSPEKSLMIFAIILPGSSPSNEKAFEKMLTTIKPL